MAKRIKINDLAKDLNVSGNEIVEFMESVEESGKKKPASTLTEEEINLVLEHYTQQNQVTGFDAYFDQRRNKNKTVSAQKTEPEVKQKETGHKEEQRTQVKKQNNSKEVSDKRSDASGAVSAGVKNNTQRTQIKLAVQEQQKSSADNRSGNVPVPKKPAPAVHTGTDIQSNKKLDSKRETEINMIQKNNNSSQGNDQKPKDRQSGGQSSDKQFAARKSSREFVRPQQNAANNRKPVQKTEKNDKNTQRGEKTSLSANMASTPTERVVRTVDTRGSYVELDKYNERYEQIAPTGNHNKDNFTRKQKITQKSAQKNKHLSKKETESEKLRRLELERARKQQLKVMIPDNIVVSELATRLKVTVSEVIKKLMGLGIMASINQEIDFDTASLVAEELGAKVEKEVIVTIEERLIDDTDDEQDMVERSPVVVVMGHVDHGKTSLLDNIRKANVTASEAGGITQHIGAYKVRVKDKYITFLDTPGHAAFTSMRARGASVTDIAVLVVAADDGIMPQTVEAINHAKAAGVSIIVAINKMDKEGANPDRVKQELTEQGLVIEEWGGDVICVPVSAKTGAGIDELLENIILVAEFRELKANPNRLAKGAVIEARLDKGRGPIATLLVQNGTLHQGDIIIAGTSVGRVRVMTNDKGKQVKIAGPSVPVEITGLNEVPSAGDTFNAVEDEKLARELVEQRKHEAKEEQFNAYQKVTLDNLFSQIAEGEIKELPIIIKADVQGSVEAVKQSLEKLSNEEIKVKVIHGGVGTISENDVMLANASNAIIVGFNVRPDPIVTESAKRDGVDIRLYRVIYDAIEEIQTAMKGMLAPKFKEVEQGRAEIRQVYKISSVGVIAGSYILDGKIARNSQIRVVRDGIVIAEDKIDSLKRFKDDAKEVTAGYECGIGLEHFNDIKEGDIFEAFIMEEYREV
ncbi:MAG: translation initiation factor IF-2 [Oscillospiraceae bacterium]|nr:translation initiation factor IF-2 [Oscillospiraceae bacterium]